MKLINTLKSTLFLNIAYVISLASIFFTASISYKHTEELNKTSDLVMKSYEVKLNLERLMSELKDAGKKKLLFNRLHGKTDYPGTGVGLAICKKIIINHSGYIHAVGKPNEGATIIMYIPTDL